MKMGKDREKKNLRNSSFRLRIGPSSVMLMRRRVSSTIELDPVREKIFTSHLSNENQ